MIIHDSYYFSLSSLYLFQLYLDFSDMFSLIFGPMSGLSKTFCSKCYVGIVSHGDGSGQLSTERKELLEVPKPVVGRSIKRDIHGWYKPSKWVVHDIAIPTLLLLFFFKSIYLFIHLILIYSFIHLFIWYIYIYIWEIIYEWDTVEICGLPPMTMATTNIIMITIIHGFLGAVAFLNRSIWPSLTGSNIDTPGSSPGMKPRWSNRTRLCCDWNQG